jgi:Uma2 family endonuclease
MPRTIVPPRRSPRPEPAPGRKRWTRKECDWLRENGLLTGRYELIDGEIINKMGQKPPHAYVITALFTWLTGLFGAAYVRIQSTIDVSASSPQYDEPEPDAAVTAQPYTAYAEQHPGPIDLLLLAEVSDTTLRFDRVAKAALYARAGIGEYWVVDVNGRQIFVHREPSPEGYRDVAAYAEHEMLAPLARPGDPVRVGDLLPPAQ